MRKIYVCIILLMAFGAQTNEQAFRDQYSLLVNNPGYYDIPRMLLLGVKMDF